MNISLNMLPICTDTFLLAYVMPNFVEIVRAVLENINVHTILAPLILTADYNETIEIKVHKI